MIDGGLGESMGAEPVTAGSRVAEDAVVTVLVKEGGDGGRYPAVVGAMAVVEVGCVQGGETLAVRTPTKLRSAAAPC